MPPERSPRSAGDTQTDGEPSFSKASLWLLVLSMSALIATLIGIILYTLQASSLLERFSTQTFGALLLGAGCVGLCLPGNGSRFGVSVGRLPGFGILLLGATALCFDARLPLLLVPSWAWAMAAWVLWRSLDDPPCLIERFVALVHPMKPDFVGPYCRKLTVAWALLLGAHSVAMALLAAAAPPAWLEGYMTWVMLPSVVLFSAGEYLVRKTTFRYYPYGGPIDRFFSTWFPAEQTELGRKSAAHIAAMRARLQTDVAPSQE